MTRTAPLRPDGRVGRFSRAKRRLGAPLFRVAVLAALGMAAGSASGCVTEAGPSLTVVSWGGSYARACVLGYHERFTAETGIEIRLESYNGGLAQVRAQVETGNVHWDVIDVEIADAVSGCDEGILEPIDPAMLPAAPDGTPAADDFFPAALTECAVGTSFFSTVYAYHSARFPEGPPSTIDDFFDLERFPGRRGMRRVPHVNLEFALIADGVPVDEVYATLDSPEGIARAFRKLDTIKDQVVWWEAGAQPPQMLADGEVVMSTAYNGRIFNAQVAEDQPFVIVWDGQVYDVGPLAIVAGTPNLDAARRFLAFASTAESMAGVGSYISYSPARRSGVPLIGAHAETGIEMNPHMPLTPEHLTRALANDWEWWSDHADEMNERFAAWLAQ